ncbi:MAG: bifunctional methylenetetrahydrofolate dehydrogenase/methenyltetrahydrofolate cyclohydrolase, partial [Polyangiaceae bacterium]|nr:bifunctional methylenetetrahydrofolate dehydrogenase/methenyltetrahydrofolate cyclohydrolase [Polyangiaceae bacterium]
MESIGRILDGKAVGNQVRDEVATEVRQFVAAYGRAPGLHVVLVGDDPASHVYVRNKEKAAVKAGIAGVTHRLPADTSEEALLSLIGRLN